MLKKIDHSGYFSYYFFEIDTFVFKIFLFVSKSAIIKLQKNNNNNNNEAFT